jgi:hypothetical protein
MPRKVFSYDRLIEVMTRDNASLDFTIYNKNSKINSKVTIRGLCHCGNSFSKTFANCFTGGGMFCLECGNQHKMNKTKSTNLERRGVEYVGSSKEIQEKMKQTNLDRRGVEYSCQSNEVKEKMKQTNIKRRGVSNPFQSKEVREKSKATSIKRLGVENPFQNEEVKKKIKETNMIKLGVENPSQSKEIENKKIATNLKNRGVKYSLQDSLVREKGKETNKRKRGVENAMQDPEVRQKVKETNLKRRGVPCSMQDPEVQEKNIKSNYRKKEFQMPSGQICIVQGYEPQALRLLLQTYKEDDIITGSVNVPEIWYTTDKKHRHYVDVYIKSINTCIEVKSTWTYKKDKEIIHIKQQRGKELGMLYEVWIMNKKGDLLEKIE